MSIDSNNLTELKQKLSEEQARIQNELERIGKQTTKSGDYSTNFSEMGEDEDENASEIEEYTDNLALEANLEKQLKDILESLEKIGNGTYGKCEKCQKDISVERLMAYPSAKKCIEC
jgi:RNA polymerase-binding protein DksA